MSLRSRGSSARVPQVGVLADLCFCSASPAAQVSEYRDLWHPNLKPTRRRRSSCLRRRGVMLWDVLIALGLVAVFLTLTTQILRATMRIPYRANEMESLAVRFDGAVGQLRRDVWNSTALATVGQDGRSVQIERGGGEGGGGGEPPVTWAIDDAGDLSRTEKEKQSWPGVAKGMTFQVDGSVLILVEPPDARGEGRRIPFASALSLGRQGRSS